MPANVYPIKAEGGIRPSPRVMMNRPHQGCNIDILCSILLWHFRQMSEVSILQRLIADLRLDLYAQNKIFNIVLRDSYVVKYPPHEQYSVAFAKKLVEKVEEGNCEVYEPLLQSIKFVVNACAQKTEDPVNPKSFYLTYGYENRKEILCITRAIWPIKFVGTIPWEAAFRATEFALANPSIFRGKKVLDLGSGTGLLGFMVAKKCDPEITVLSDYLPVVLDNLRYSLDINRKENLIGNIRIEVRMIDWTDARTFPCEKFDVITCTDCIYEPSLIPALLNLVDKMLSLNKKAIAYFVTTKRNAETFNSFQQQLLAKKEYKCSEITLQASLVPKLFSYCCAVSFTRSNLDSQIRITRVSFDDDVA